MGASSHRTASSRAATEVSSAVSSIARLGGYGEREHQAATIIQAEVRSKLVRLKLGQLRQEKVEHQATKVIQATARGALARKDARTLRVVKQAKEEERIAQLESDRRELERLDAEAER